METRHARRGFQRALQAERRKIVQDVGAAIESLMETGKVQEAWIRIYWWYRQARGAQAPPTLEALDEVSTERAELYRCRPPEVLRVPILVRQSDIEDGIPTEAELGITVKVLKGVRVWGAPGMRAEDLKEWLW